VLQLYLISATVEFVKALFSFWKSLLLANRRFTFDRSMPFSDAADLHAVPKDRSVCCVFCVSLDRNVQNIFPAARFLLLWRSVLALRVLGTTTLYQ